MPCHESGDNSRTCSKNADVIQRLLSGTETRADRGILASILLQAVHDSLYLDDRGRPMRPEAACSHGPKKAEMARAWLTGTVAGLYLLHLDIVPDAAISHLRRKWEDMDRFVDCEPVMH